MLLIRAFLADETGTTMVEYATIGALISIAILTGAVSIGTRIQALFYGPLGSALN